jgi:carboxypeptidase Taq
MKKEQFYALFGEIHNIVEALQILDWDQQVFMPKGGFEQRAETLSTLSTIVHKKITSEKTGEIIYAFEKKAQTDWDRAHIREAKRSYEKQRKIPTQLIAEKTKVSSVAQSVWEEAKPKSDYKTFLPHLKRVVDVLREISRCGDEENPYDFLLDDYEPYITTKILDPLFENIKNELKILIQKYKAKSLEESLKPIKRFVSKENQEKIGIFLLNEIGFDFERGRVDVSTHPFTSGTMSDVRITTRYIDDFLPASLFSILHEGGHAIYEQNLDKENFRYPAGESCSLGIHESQSRFYENIIGRSRGFSETYFSKINELSNNGFEGIKLDDFYRAINTVYPTFIRIEADEVTYNLHIILRYELEKKIIKGEVMVNDIPDLWNEKFEELFGIKPPTFEKGFMQDVHWSAGLMGYFPTYSLGNIYGGQIKWAIEKETMPLSDFVRKGKLADLKEILREKIHRFGRFYPANELIQKATGQALSEKHYLNYLKEKYENLL